MKTITSKHPYKVFNRTVCLIAVLAGTMTHHSPAALISYEGFDYPDGTNIVGQSGGTGWAGPWDDGTGQVAASTVGHLSPVVNNSLTYTDGIGNTLVVTGNKLLNSGTNRVDQFNSTSRPARTLPYLFVTNGTTTWLSFLGKRIGDLPMDRGANLTLFNTNVWTVNSGGQLAVGESSGIQAGVTNDTWSLVPLAAGTRRRASQVPFTNSVLVVIRIEHHDNTNDTTATPDLEDCDNAFFWLNPQLGVEPNTNSVVTNILSTDISGPLSQGFDFAFSRIVLFAGNAATVGGVPNPSAEWYVDEIRVGETYADVTPYIPANLTARWTNAVVTGNNISLTLTGAVSTTYRAVSRTSLSSGSWSVVGNLTTDANGVGSITDTNALATQPAKYYGVDTP